MGRDAIRALIVEVCKLIDTLAAKGQTPALEAKVKEVTKRVRKEVDDG